jgi:hypothetical protein
MGAARAMLQFVANVIMFERAIALRKASSVQSVTTSAARVIGLPKRTKAARNAARSPITAQVLEWLENRFPEVRGTRARGRQTVIMMLS